MGYLVSDAAAGSTAARTMQQNVYAAPYDQQNIAADAESKQIRLQTDQANLDKTKLSNLISDSDFKIAEDSRDKLKQMAQTPKFKAAEDAEKLKMMGNVQAETGDVKGFSDTMGKASIFEARDIAKSGKEMEDQIANIGRAASNIKFIDPEDLPQAQKDAIDKHIGKEAFANMDLPTKQAALENLMYNASGKLQQQKMENDLKKAQMAADSRLRTAEIAAQWHMAMRMGRGNGDSDRMSARESRQELSMMKTLSQLDDGEKQRTKLEGIRDAAKVRVDEGRLFGLVGASDSTTAAYTSANKAVMDFEKGLIQKREDVVKLFAPGDNRTRMMKELSIQKATYGMQAAEQRGEAPEADAPKANTPKAPAAPKAEQKNAGADFNSKWATLKSGETLTGPDGKTYTKK